jgi:TonB family protein
VLVAGNGAGSGSGDGTGDGIENLGKELHARILGDVTVDLPGDDQHRTVLTHDQATALRQRDIFPRLPESLWPAWRPYIVTLRVCVDEQGRVSDATLLSSAAPRLDRMVAAAARSWQYRPLQAMGHATAFCHAVVIQYEHW